MFAPVVRQVGNGEEIGKLIEDFLLVLSSPSFRCRRAAVAASRENRTRKKYGNKNKERFHDIKTDVVGRASTKESLVESH